MSYTKHQVKRIRDLNEKYFEVVFQKESLNFNPGDCVVLWTGPEIPIFVASGIQEPWVRIILNRDLFPNITPGDLSIRFNKDITSKLSTLPGSVNPSFVFDTNTIGAFFSWTSTNPGKPCKVLYLGDYKIQEDWIKAYHNVVDVSKLKREKELYVTGNRDLFIPKKYKKLPGRCKESYII